MRILLVSENQERIARYKEAFAAYEFAAYSDPAIIKDFINAAPPDIIFTDGQIPETDAMIVPAVDDLELALKTLNTALRIKKLSTANKDLKNDLYHLKVLYETGSQFSETLDKDKITRYMIEGLDRALSFSLCTTLVPGEEPTLLVNGVYELSDELIKELNPCGAKVVKTIKNPAKRFSFDVLQYNTLSDDCIKIYRETPFTHEDETFFQTIIAQAAAPIHNAQLYEKVLRLEKLKSEFVSIVSHELRTPLTSIKNSLDILAVGGQSEKFLPMAQRNVGRLDAIIRDLLDLSRIEAGKMNYQFAPTDIHSVVEYVKTEFGAMIEEKGIKLNVCEAANLPLVNADVSRLEQVLSNLVSNAVKFTNDCITIKTELSDDNILVSVEDNGPGVASEACERIFEPFVQIEGTLSRNTGGSGLGLPIARRLVEAHNGAIWCEDSVFKFTIPV